MKEDKQKLLKKAQDLADKQSELKSIIEKMIDEFDELHIEYLKVLDEIKQK